MGYERAEKALNLEKTDRIPSVETIENPQFVQTVSGLDPFKNVKESYIEAYKKLDMDMVFRVPWRGSYRDTTREIAAESIEGSDYKGSSLSNIQDDWLEEMQYTGARTADTQWGIGRTRWVLEHRFKSMDEALRFDPLVSGPADADGIAGKYMLQHEADQGALGKITLVPAWYSFTLFQYPLRLIGWPLLARVAYQRPKEFDTLLERFAELSIRHFEAWSKTNIVAFMSHDDLGTYHGPVMPPKWFREHIFPLYKRIWAPLHRKRIKVIWISDGNMTPLLDDVIEAGADGFKIDPSMDLELTLKKYGDNKILLGNFDTRLLTYGTEEKIVEEVKHSASLAQGCPGFFFRVVGHIPNNVPMPNVKAYFDACRKYGVRSVST